MPSASTSTATATYGQSYNPVSYGSNSNYTNSNGPSTTATTSAAADDSSRYVNNSYDARTPPRPPASIAHLQSQTRIPDSDALLPLKSLLRSADSYRMQGQQREREGDIEAAFVAFGIAAQYALELVPAHAEYGERLTREQRAALEKNGERILERISVLKDAIIQRQEDYMRNYGDISEYTTLQHQSDPPPAEQTTQPPSQQAYPTPSQSYPTPTQSFPQPPAKLEYRDFRPDLPVSQSASQQASKYSSASQQAKHRDAVLQSARQAASTTTAPIYAPQSSYSAPRSEQQQRTEAVMDGVRSAAASRQNTKYSSKKTHKDAVLESARAAAASTQPGSSHTIVQMLGDSQEDRRRAQQEAFKKREEEIAEKKRKEKRQAPPLASHGSMPSIANQNSLSAPPLTSHATMPSVPTLSNQNNPAMPVPDPPAVRLIPPSQSQAQVSMPAPLIYQSTSTTMSGSQAQPAPQLSAQYTGSSGQGQYSDSSSQYTGTSGLSPQFTGMSTSSAPSSVLTQPSSRPPAQIPPQFQLPPMPPPSVYPPIPSRRPPEGNKDMTRPITDNGALTPQRQAPRPPPSSYPTAYLAPTRDGDSRPPDISEQFSQMSMGNSSSAQSTPQPQLMPLESPTRYGYEGDSTDSETVARESVRRREHHGRRVEGPRRAEGSGRGDDSYRYPPPITTTSPAPPDLPVTLMTTHQKAQGYHPSLNSMFCAKPPPSLTGSSLLYDPGMQKDSRHQGSLHQHHHHHSNSSSRPQQADVSRSSSIQWESRADAAHGSSSSRYEEHNREPTRLESGRILKTVYVPRACLHRFNAIAKANTLVNKETCGLLLGKDNRELVKTPARRRDAYVVTTLLIPKQRATSDTCAMEEEESVLRFTEERGLITLGWIHTHPTQTCFMSSVDLHTHSGFQCMLPESFAVVCAPRQKPNYGIFRLTDPLGLQTVLQCTAKAAFHPHPDVPIYTDADRGHVVMRDEMSLEIVDLR